MTIIDRLGNNIEGRWFYQMFGLKRQLFALVIGSLRILSENSICEYIRVVVDNVGSEDMRESVCSVLNS